MGNGTSKKQSKTTECFEIIGESDSPDSINNKCMIDDAIAVVKEELNHLKSEKISNQNDDNVDKNTTKTIQGDGDFEADNEIVKNGQNAVDAKLAVDVNSVQKMSSPSSNDSPNKNGSDKEGKDIHKETLCKDLGSTNEKMNKKSKKTKESKKDKTTKKKERLSKKGKEVSKKTSLKEGKPVSVMIENDTYLSLNYVPHRENGTTTPNESSTEPSSKCEDYSKDNSGNFDEVKTISAKMQKESNPKENDLSNEDANNRECPNENIEEISKVGSNYLQETFDLIDEAHKSIPVPQTERTALLEIKGESIVNGETEMSLTTSYRRESQTIVDDVLVEHNITKVSSEISDESEVGSANNSFNESLLQELAPGVVNRIVNDNTITEVVNMGDCVNITITTITESTSSDSVNDTMVLSQISSTINNNPNESVNETVVITDTSAVTKTRVNDPGACGNTFDENFDLINNLEVQKCESGQNNVSNTKDSKELKHVVESNNGPTNARNLGTENETSKSMKTTKDKKKQKSEEKKIKKESKRKQKSKTDKQNKNIEEPESPVANVSDLINKFECKSSENKKLRISLSKSISKSDDEKKGKRKKKNKQQKGQRSPSFDEQKEFASPPLKGIFDDVPVEIEVHDVDTVSLSSRSSDETEGERKNKSKGQPIAAELPSPKDNTQTNLLSVNTEAENRPRSDEYVVLLSVNKDELQKTVSPADNYEEDKQGDTLESIVHTVETVVVDTDMEVKLGEKLDESPTERVEKVSETTEQHIGVTSDSLENEIKAEVVDSQDTGVSDYNISKKKSKKESKKKRGSKLFVFRHNSDASKSTDIPQQDVSFEQNPQSNSPKERRRSFSEFLRPVFGNIFSKNSPSSPAKRKSKVEVEECSKVESVETDTKARDSEKTEETTE